MVKDEVWEAAVISPWQPFFYLCIACLEKRLGRTLMASEFTDVGGRRRGRGDGEGARRACGQPS
jgi:hypothetical protein